MITPKVRAVMVVILLVGLAWLSKAQAQGRKDATSDDIFVTSFERMKYPPIARKARIQGRVVVRVELNETGRVVSASAVSGEPLLTPDALSNARKWRFHPNADKVALVVYDFRLRSQCVQYKSASRFAFKEPNMGLVTDCEFEVQP